MKGIILAGGSGSRLYPLTQALSKQLLPVFDKPMIYYPLSVLMLAGIKDIAVICSATAELLYRRLLGDGGGFGLNLTYLVQNHPNGIAEALIIGEDFIGCEPVCLILGDNIFYGPGFSEELLQASSAVRGCNIFAYQVPDPERFGVIEIDSSGKALSVEEKPLEPKSNLAVTGLYFYDYRATQFAKTLRPSSRGELEITDLNRIYIDEGSAKVSMLGRGFAWLDAGTPSSLIEASQFVYMLEKNQGVKIACLEEIALNQGWIDEDLIIANMADRGANPYDDYVRKIISRQNLAG